MVEESLNSLPDHSGTKKRYSNQRLRPRYYVLESVILPPTRSRKSKRRVSSRSRQRKAQEVETQFNILRSHVNEISGANPDVWVLIVVTQMKSVLDAVKLEDLSRLYRFQVHWLTTGSKRRYDTKFNQIIVDILRNKNEQRR